MSAVEINPVALFIFFIRSFFVGAFLGLLYDVLKSRRIYNFPPIIKFCERVKFCLIGPRTEKIRKAENYKNRKISVVLAFFKDLLFCIFTSLLISILTFYSNNGKLRMIPLLGGLIGVILYCKLFGKLINATLYWVFFFFCLILEYILFFVTFPILRIFEYMKKIWIIVMRRFDKIITEYIESTFTKKETKKLLNLASDGFIRKT